MTHVTVGAGGARPQSSSFITRRTSPHATAREAGLIQLLAVAMTLVGYPVSDIAVAAIGELTAEIYFSNGRRRRPSCEYVGALGAIVADLLTAASYDPVRPCIRRMGLSSFTGMKVGYRAAYRAISDLQRSGYVEYYPGDQGNDEVRGELTHVRSTPAFVERLEQLGVNATDRLAHFAYGKPPLPSLPIKLVSSSGRTPTWKKVPGERIILKKSDVHVEALRRPIDALNAFFADHAITLETSRLQRAYSEVSIPETVSFSEGSTWGKSCPIHGIRAADYTLTAATIR